MAESAVLGPSIPHAKPRVRFNPEYFGFIVGFPDGEIVLSSHAAMRVLHGQVTKEELSPYLLPSFEVVEGFHLGAPLLVWFELTRRCDLACPHCYINGGRRRQNEMPDQRLFELLDEMADFGVWGVAFTGGEPTLHPAFVDLVRHARSRDLLVGVATHGMRLTDELLGGLPREGVIISVSIDDLHVGRRGHDVSTERAKDAILRAQAHGFLTNVMTNTHRLNIGRLGEMMRWAEDNGVSVRSVPFSPLGRGKLHRDLENTKEDVEAAAEFWIRECEWEHEYHRRAGRRRDLKLRTHAGIHDRAMRERTIPLLRRRRWHGVPLHDDRRGGDRCQWQRRSAAVRGRVARRVGDPPPQLGRLRRHVRGLPDQRCAVLLLRALPSDVARSPRHVQRLRSLGVRDPQHDQAHGTARGS
jgi:MoaA/NifB/PqqE/SkfB family radical SAM enzyme